MKNSIIIFLSIVVTSCVSEHNGEKTTFSHEDFLETKILQAQPLKLDSVVNFNKVYCVSDSFLLANNDDPAQKNKVQLYTLDGDKVKGGFAQLGHSKSELISCDIHYCNSGGDIFYVQDIVQNKYWVCSVESLKNNKPCVLSSFNYSKDVISVCPLDSTYVGLDFWYIDIPEYNNGIESPLTFYSCNENIARNRSRDYNYFVANVGGGVVFSNPVNGDIWVAFSHDNNISIYDADLCPKKQMNGPCAVEKHFQTRQIKGQQYVFFERDYFVDCYYDVAYTTDHVYLLYRNVNNIPYPKQLSPVEVHKFTWRGEPLSNYKLDRYAYSISVNTTEDMLYATCIDPETSEPQFVKYKL